jgi:uncharacterized protein YodC (DUF2158 family)
MKKLFAYSNIGVLQFILFTAMLLVPAEDKILFVWWLAGAVLFEWAGLFLLELFKGRSIKCGDVVQLKSGGPKMVVEGLRLPHTWWCIWFDENGKQQAADFRKEILNRA